MPSTAPQPRRVPVPERSNVVRAETGVQALGDADLVARALAGDRWAEEVLYRRHVRALWGMALRMLGHAADAEDTVQDTFATALRELHRLREPAALRGWLLRIGVRHVHRRLRRRRLRRLLGLGRAQAEDEVTLESIASEASSPEARAELALVDRVLARVPSEHRIAWMLRHVEGESLEEVASACGCSLATVKRRISAVQQQLQSHIQAGEVDHG